MSDKDACRRWTIPISQLRSRAAKARRGGTPDRVELVEQSLSLCDGIVAIWRAPACNSMRPGEARRPDRVLDPSLRGNAGRLCRDRCQRDDRRANPAAAVLFNTSVKHLTARLPMHFAEDRDQFGQLLRGLSTESVRHRCALIIRPRERAPVQMEATVLVRSPGDVSSWLWFFTPFEHP